MTNYRRGADFERRVCKYFDKQGYFTVRSAGSHSPIDLVAIKAGEVKLIQCKIDGVLSLAEREQLQELSKDSQCQVLLIYREGRRMRALPIKEDN